MRKRVILSILCALILSLTAIPAFADEPADVVYTLNASTNPGVFCGGNSGVTCSDYSYLMIDSNFIQSDFSNPGVAINLALYASFSNVTTQYNQGIGFSRHIVFSLSDISKLESWWVGSTNVFPQDWEVKLTLTNDFENCPTPEPCPDPVEAPYFVQLVIDAFWKYHVAFAGGAVAILAIFLFYRLVKGGFANA